MMVQVFLKRNEKKLLSGNKGRVGFSNVLKKLKLIKKAKLILESEEGVGTKITIILPEVKEDESSTY